MDVYTPSLTSQKIDTRFSVEDKKKLKEQTDGFEALVLQHYLEKSLQMDDSLFPKQAGSDIYKSMYTETLSRHLSGSFGYSELLFKHLTEN